MKKQPTIEQQLKKALAERDYAREQLGVTLEALNMIVAMNWGCGHGGAKSGLEQAAYVARLCMANMQSLDSTP